MRTFLGIALVLSLGLVTFPWLGGPWLLLLIGGGAVGARLRGRSARAYLRELDELAAAGEKAIVAASLVVMTGAVFVDVVWRTSHSLDPDTARIFAAALLGICLMAGLTARRPGASQGRRVLEGLGAFAVILGLVLLIHSVPHGFGWSQRLALVLLLWVGLLGASLASQWGRHIQVDAVRRVVPPRWRRLFEVMAELVTVGLLSFLTLLAGAYARRNWADFTESDFRSAVFESLPIPYLAASLPIVIGFTLMLARSLRALVEGPVQAELLESLGRAEPSDELLDADPPRGAGAP